jgi:glycosyltransferase involved in cell wall biosynthesis
MPSLERQFDISHIHTSLSDWHFLNALGCRPILLTLTSNGQNIFPNLLDKVSYVVGQSERLVQTAIVSGIPQERISLIYPGVNLEIFRDSPPPPIKDGILNCLFASSPEEPSEIHTKGLDLLLDLAASESNIEVTILWRPFGRQSDLALRKVQERLSQNVVIHQRRIEDIHRFYGQFHFTVAPFRTVGKPCPNSILESLAAGRPVLVSRYVDVADLIEREEAGISFEQSLSGIQSAFQLLYADYQSLQGSARTCAEKYFDLQNTVRAYKNIYECLYKNEK